MRYLIAILALLIASPIHARPIVWGGTPCTNSSGDGCYNGGSIHVPTFFRGYATQGSAGTSYNAGSTWFVSWSAATSLQPVVYPVRPPQNVAGVDYAVGQPRWLQPAIGNLHPSSLKDPALIASDPLANPDGPGADCNFVASNVSVSGGVAAGGTSAPFPFPNDGPGIYCTHASGSVGQLIFDGYNFGWNSSTGYGCVPVYIAAQNYGTGAAQNSPATASVIVRNSLFVNGPQCNIWGEFGNGTNQAGPNSASSALMFNIGGNSARANTLGFYNNTVYGCGGDSLATALETALCSASFNSTTYSSGGTTMITGATVGVAPVQSLVLNQGTPGTTWVQDNAFLHLPSRFSNPVYVNLGGAINVTNNYIEGMTYTIGPQFQIASLVNSGGTTETITTVAPHGIPIGSNTANQISTNGSALNSGWAHTFTMTATGASTLTFTSPTNYGDWTYSSGNYPNAVAATDHGEFMEPGSLTSGATFTGTISGTTLTVSGLTGTLAAGQYITAATGSGLSIPSPTYIVSGTGPYTLNQAPGNMTGSMVSPYYTVGASGSVTPLQISYNTFLQTPSVAGDSNTALWYIFGAYNYGVPFVQFTGSIDHNVMVNDLTPGLTHRSTSATVEFAYSAIGPAGLSVSNNYIDPTGNFYCWEQLGYDAGGPITLSGNVNMLMSSADPYINQQDAYSIVPYNAGTSSNSQAENGISYNSGTGVVTVTLSNSTLPSSIYVGATVGLSNTKVSTGTNYLAGQHTVTGVSGNTFTFAVATGYPGTATGINPVVTPYAGSTPQTCYGHN